ncbi:hydrogenase-1 operon protein HyaF [Ruegeria intermedia]|uniref:Hydrogenase-1 operon protein HyaF n=1 Tax=Ruegeria intermedia TaxID=996115 RepID=A0A1M5B265_9RHOB|nr:hydrogenase expression/formation protein [Ruegeria intermedia]SHF36604.1 hydrogenase-1 operon protein HyaF [Ruegeria intermedia]
MANFHLPPIGFGPGSQPADAEGGPQYPPMPQEMRVFVPPSPEVTDPERLAPALELLSRFAAACQACAGDGTTAGFDLATLDTANRALIAGTLGQGEVSIRVRGVPAVAVQESVFAGVWVLSGHGIDRVEVAPIPSLALERAFAPTRSGKGADAPRGPAVVNAPPLLVELQDKSAAFAPGSGPHVVNLTLLPHTEEDLVWLDAALGEGSVTILSRGYGNCRITATALPHVWRVQFFNSMDTLILDTFEVTSMPEVALAATEDLSDSAGRLARVLESIR